MPRKPRKPSKSKIYHVMIRGNEKKNIFLDDDDKTRFLETLYYKKKHNSFEVYAYCLMENHVHLLLKEGNEKISKIMQRINVSYVYYFNKKYDRIGHLFQDRFRSETIEDNSYLLAATRYIHNNPVKADIVKNAGEYQWSSYRAYTTENDGITDTLLILGILSNNLQKAQELFKEFSIEKPELEFLENNEKNIKEISISRKDVCDYIKEYLCNNGLLLEELKTRANKKKREALIKDIRGKTDLSEREIAGILGVKRNMIRIN